MIIIKAENLSSLFKLSFRVSCKENCLWIKAPTIRNNLALAKAWVNKWNKVTILLKENKLKNISPSCLNVDRATSFFPSSSTIAAIDAKARVITLVK